jgi:hypothetical protein
MPSRECLSPTVDAKSGITHCKTRNGGTYQHRHAVGQGCGYTGPSAGGAGGAGGEGAGGDGAGGACDAAACAGEYPYCERASLFPTSRCAEGCNSDADCATGFICRCGATAEGLGACVAADCASDAECGEGLRCRAQYDDCVEYPSQSVRFRCESVDDHCTTAQDCSGQGALCEHDSTRFICVEPGAVCGRPFLVEGTARAAALAPRGDWLSREARPDVSSLSAAERSELARHYARAGQMEHASIAAFARFSLQLLSLGAPAELVEACTAAISDETRHARTCFALASHYAGAELGPSALPLDGCLAPSSLQAIVELVIVEGCIGETVAALEAAEAAAHASDPAVRAVLQAISEDEKRHAELAYRFVAWALAERGDLAPLVRRAFDAQARSAPRPPLAASDTSRLGAHGLLSPAHLAEVRDQALRDAVLPCARALLGRPRPGSPVATLERARGQLPALGPGLPSPGRHGAYSDDVS